jgi:hypothetical protein
MFFGDCMYTLILTIFGMVSFNGMGPVTVAISGFENKDVCMTAAMEHTSAVKKASSNSLVASSCVPMTAKNK